MKISDKLKNLAQDKDKEFYVSKCDGAYYAYWTIDDIQHHRKINKTTFQALEEVYSDDTWYDINS